MTFIGCSQTELALYNLESNSLSTHCNISLFLSCLMNSEPSVLAAAAAYCVCFRFVGLGFKWQLRLEMWLLLGSCDRWLSQIDVYSNNWYFINALGISYGQAAAFKESWFCAHLCHDQLPLNNTSPATVHKYKPFYCSVFVCLLHPLVIRCSKKCISYRGHSSGISNCS